MAVVKNPEQAAAPGLFVSLRSFLGAVLATICTRFELVGVELEEQARFAARLVLSSLAALLCLSTAFFFLMLLIVAIFWAYKVLVLSIILAVYVLGALVFGLIAKALVVNRPKLMQQTLAELRKDVDGLRKPLGSVSTKGGTAR
jgi:uncharacterized membrane protein YqjE